MIFNDIEDKNPTKIGPVSLVTFIEDPDYEEEFKEKTSDELSATSFQLVGGDVLDTAGAYMDWKVEWNTTEEFNQPDTLIITLTANLPTAQWDTKDNVLYAVFWDAYDVTESGGYESIQCAVDRSDPTGTLNSIIGQGMSNLKPGATGGVPSWNVANS